MHTLGFGIRLRNVSSVICSRHNNPRLSNTTRKARLANQPPEVCATPTPASTHSFSPNSERRPPSPKQISSTISWVHHIACSRPNVRFSPLIAKRGPTLTWSIPRLVDRGSWNLLLAWIADANPAVTSPPPQSIRARCLRWRCGVRYYDSGVQINEDQKTD
jgi:hypothetical protein